MKHHGNYWLPSVEELRKCAEIGAVSFVVGSLGRLRRKNHNDKRHRRKHRDRGNGGKPP